ncbi:MAG: Asp-tRNA(Asn)/Glu-tRNA(Gln) amidotransferase subunit GatC [Bacteroidota bacterium]|jgi:aspartyl-tRNA(Asn)/glutamyl-tRNA(Gln) amidotransferase subunit C
MEVTYKLIDDLAALARLHIPETEKENLRNDMEKMILFFEQLQSIPTNGIQPLLHMTEEIDKLRIDTTAHLITREKALNAATNKTDEFFLVPKVIKK